MIPAACTAPPWPRSTTAAAAYRSAGFRGVSAEQDSRFGNKEKKLMKVQSWVGAAAPAAATCSALAAATVC